MMAWPELRVVQITGGHVRLDPGFVDEDEARRIKPTLVFLPLRPAPRDGGTELFGGQHGFF